MKLQYLGDARDAFKWDLLHWICTRSSPPFSKLLFVPLLTPDVEGSNEGLTPDHWFACRDLIRPFLASLRAEPRSLDRISALGTAEPNRSFQASMFAPKRFIAAGARRPDYWSGFDTSELENSVVFFDPDKGFETETQHGQDWIRHSELKDLFARLPETSVAVVYQHRPRRKWNDVFADLEKKIDYAHIAVAAYEANLAFVAMAATNSGQRITAALKNYTEEHHPILKYRPFRRGVLASDSLMCDELPTSVRYVKNGRGSRWWQAARTNAQVHLGWGYIPHELLLKGDFGKVKQTVKKWFGSRSGATQDFNALKDVLDAPSQHIWITFEDGFMWWCTVRDGANVNEAGETTEKGYFWLNCATPWSKTSVQGKLLAISDLPGTVTATAGFRATVCEPRAWHSIRRLIQDETDPDATKAAEVRRDYELAVDKMVKQLSPKDFEHLIDLILARTGWERISTLGGTREGIDMEAENPTASEIAFVQVKSSATQAVLNNYVERFNKQRDRYARMIFAVHSPSGELRPPADLPVQLWTGERVAELVVRLGLGKWVESRLA